MKSSVLVLALWIPLVISQCLVNVDPTSDQAQRLTEALNKRYLGSDATGCDSGFTVVLNANFYSDTGLATSFDIKKPVAPVGFTRPYNLIISPGVASFSIRPFVVKTDNGGFTSVTLNGMSFKDLVSPVTTNSDTFVNSCNFGVDTGDVDHRKGLKVNSGNLEVDKSTFTGLKTTSNGGGVSVAGAVTLKDSNTFDGCTAGKGGSVYATGSITVQGNNNIFKNCASTGGDGGALYTTSSVSVNAGALFESNSASGKGGSIYATDVQLNSLAGLIEFTNCNSASDGGSIYAKGKVMLMSGTNIFDSSDVSSYSTNGGAIYSTDLFTVSGGENTFSNLKSKDNGGAVYAKVGAQFTAGTSTFDSVSALSKDGGAIYDGSDTAGVEFSGSTNTFSGCTARYGGCIYSKAGVKISSAISFTGELATLGATLDGGAIYAKGLVNLEGISTKTFKTLSSGRDGGAIYSADAVSLHGTGTDNGFDATSSIDQGGAIYAKGKVTFDTNSKFEFKNLVSGNAGAAIYCEDSVTVEGSNTFSSLLATGSGGAIYSRAAVTILKGQSFSNCESKDRGGAIHSTSTVSITGKVTFDLCKGSDAGAIWADDSITLTGISATDRPYFSNNVADGNPNNPTNDGGAIRGLSVTIDGLGAHFKKNLAEQGGAVVASGGAVTIQNSLFEDNGAKIGGGAIYQAGNGFTSSVSDSVFTSNYAQDNDPSIDASGGAIWAKGSINLLRSQFTTNSARTSGGALRCDRKTSVSDCTFAGNHAGVSGGAIRSQQQLEVASSTFGPTGGISNSAGYGGAIHSELDVTIKNSVTFVSCKATAGSGGGIYSAKTVTFTEDQTFGNGNSATKSGGSVYSSGATTFLKKCTATSSTSGESGGVVYSKGALVFNDDVSFTSNCGASKDGGSVYSESSVTFEKKCTIYDSTSLGVGGAIYSRLALQFKGEVDVKGFKSVHSGGAIHARSTVTFDSTAKFESGSTTDGPGGAIYSLGDLLVKGTSTFSNLASNTNLAATIPSIVSAHGGAIYCEGAISFSAPATFTSISAHVGNGGALYSTKTISFSDDVSFVSTKTDLDNTVVGSGKGGAIFAFGAVTFTKGSSFDGSVAGLSGGAIYSETDVTLGPSFSFKNNQAITGDGGAIWAKTSVTASLTPLDSSFSVVQFENNKAGGQGGAVYSPSLSTSGAYWKSNEAGQGGVYFGPQLLASDSKFELNKAAKGDVFYVTGNANLATSYFLNNFKANAGLGSVYVAASGFLTLTASDPSWSNTDIWLENGAIVRRSTVDVIVQCVDLTTMPVVGNLGKTSCVTFDTTKVSTVKFTVTEDGTHNRFQLRNAVILSSKADPTKVYVVWSSPLVKRDAHNVYVVFSGTPTETYNDVYNLQLLANYNPNLVAQGFTPSFSLDFSNVQMHFANQVNTDNQCAQHDTAPCLGNGYCVNIKPSTHIGFCSCMSGYSALNCETKKDLGIVPAAALQLTDAQFQHTFSISIGNNVVMEVVLPTNENDNLATAMSFATSTLLKFGGSTPDCDYPNVDKKWSLSTVEDSNDHLWYDHYTQSFSYADLQKCGLTRVDTSRTDFAFFNNSLSIERNYAMHNGRFSINRRTQADHSFSLMFPLKISSTSNIKVRNNTVEFLVSVSEVSYSTSTHLWRLKLSAYIANDYKLKSTFVAGSTATTNPFHPEDRDFDIVSQAGVEESSSNEITLQTFEFTFKDCKSFEFNSFTFDWDVVCRDTTESPCNPDQSSVSIVLDVRASPACPVSGEFDITDEDLLLYGAGTDLALPKASATEKTLFGTSEKIYFAIDFTVPATIKTITLVNLCGYASPAPATLVPCPSVSYPSLQTSSHHSDHKFAFEVNAGELKQKSGVQTNSFVVQADITIEYMDTFSKRTVSYNRDYSSASTVSVGEISENLVEVDREQNSSDPSASFVLSCSLILLLGVFFITI